MFFLILLYVALTIVRPQDYMPALAGVPLLSVVLVLAFASWLASSAKTFEAPQFLLLPVFLLAMMASLVFNGWAGGAIEQIGQFGPVIAAFFVLATAVAAKPGRLRKTFMLFVLCAMVLALHGVDQKLYGVGWTGVGTVEDGRIQYVGIFKDPNDLGMLFVAVLPMAGYLSAGGGMLRRVFWLAGAALLVYGVYLTNSRGALLAVLVVGGGYLWHRRGLVVAGSLGAVGLLVMRLLSSRMQELDADESSAAGRVNAWYEGLHMFMAKPLFGVGTGNFTEYNELTAHNSFVLVLAETGLFGFVVWLAFVGYGFMMMAAVLRTAQPPRREAEEPLPPAPPSHALAAADTSRARVPAWQPVAGATHAEAADAAADWATARAQALTMLLSLSGMFAAAFFLSRSYTVVLYLVIALAVGHYVDLRRRYPGLRAFSLADDWWRWLPRAGTAIVALGVVVIVLLHSS